MRRLFFILIILLDVFYNCHAESKKLIVLLDWFANPNHAPLFVAEQQGFFKEQGLEVELIGPSDPSDPPKLVAANKADIAITYQPHFIEQVAEGLPLIAIGTLIDKPLNALVVLKNGPIHSLQDLKHRRVGYSTGGMTGLTLKIMLETNKIQSNEVDHINVHYDLTQALLAKKVDAVTGIMRNFELIQLELAGYPARAFFPEENGIPTYSELILVINKNRKHDPQFIKFLTALQKGMDYLQKHPTSSWQAFAKTHPALNDELNQRAWSKSLPYFSHRITDFNKKEWENFAMFMQQNGLIKHHESFESYVLKS